MPKPGASLDEAALIEATKRQLAPFKAPKSVIVVDELPKTSTGKIQKNVVRKQFADHYGAS